MRSADAAWSAALDRIEQELRRPISRSEVLAGRADEPGEPWSPPTGLGPLPPSHAERAARIVRQLDERRAAVSSLAQLVAEHRRVVDAVASEPAPARFLDAST